MTKFYPTTGNVKTVAIFSTGPSGKGKPFSQPFMDEAKAVLADHLRQSNTRQVSRVVAVLREIYAALPIYENVKSLNSLSDCELYLIEERISEKFVISYTFCRILERLVQRIIEPSKITKSRLSWLSGQKYKGANRSDLVGERNRVTNTAGTEKSHAIAKAANQHNANPKKAAVFETLIVALDNKIVNLYDIGLFLNPDASALFDGRVFLDDGFAYSPEEFKQIGLCKCESNTCFGFEYKVHCAFPQHLSDWVIKTGLYRGCYDEVIHCSRCHSDHKRGHVGLVDFCKNPYKNQSEQSDYLA